MCGMPQRSRTTRTGADNPATAIVPDVTGVSGGGALGGRSRAQPASASASNGAIRYTTGMAIKDGLLVEFDHEMATTRKLFERVPADRLSWKPHPKSMSFGGICTHLAHLPVWGGTILSNSSFDLASAPPNTQERTSRAEILALFEETTRKTRAALDKTDAELVAPWSLRRGGQEMFTLPRVAAFRTFFLYHSVHHRGQLSVYLRLNDIPVPAIYGPTADET